MCVIWLIWIEGWKKVHVFVGSILIQKSFDFDWVKWVWLSTHGYFFKEGKGCNTLLPLALKRHRFHPKFTITTPISFYWIIVTALLSESVLNVGIWNCLEQCGFFGSGHSAVKLILGWNIIANLKELCL